MRKPSWWSPEKSHKQPGKCVADQARDVLDRGNGLVGAGSGERLKPGNVAAIEKAISNADLGLNPSNDGVVIRLTFPSLTEERRKSFVKIVHTKAEEGRVALRGCRRHARQELEALEKDKSISSDDLEHYEKILDKMTQEEVALVDALLAHKEQELLEV